MEEEKEKIQQYILEAKENNSYLKGESIKTAYSFIVIIS